MKRIISFLLCITVFASALCLSGCFQFLSLDNYSVYPALWIIEDRDGHRCYLFGTENTGKDDGIFPLPDVIEDAYSYCEAVAVSYDVTEANTKEPIKYTDGTTIKDHLSERVYNAAVSVITANEGEYNGKYDSYHICEWYSIIERYTALSYGYKTEFGTDRYFINKAKDDGKAVYGLESAEYQTELLLSISDKVYEQFMISVLNSRGSTSYDYYYQLYTTGDADSLARMVNSSKSAVYNDAELKAQMDGYYDLMFKERNKATAEAIMNFLSEGKRVFVAVSCTNIVGTDGVAAVLSSSGYKVIRK